MKFYQTLLSAVFTGLFLMQSAWAQVPDKMSYQAVIRNNSNQLVTNQTIGMRISILQGSATGTVVYTETQAPLANENGLVSIEIGTGVSMDDFSEIDWTNGPYFIKTEADPAGGTSYTITGTSQILSVPYALHAKTVASYDEADPVFGTSSAKDIATSDIENWNTAYGWGNHAGLYKQASYLPEWSNIKSKPTSVAGYGITDAVNLDSNQCIGGHKKFSHNILVDEMTIGPGICGNCQNTTIGIGSLASLVEGFNNTGVGYRTLRLNTFGSYNTAIGSLALEHSKGSENTAIGLGALGSGVNNFQNAAVGAYAGSSNTNGGNNVFIGYCAGYEETGSDKLYIDSHARGNETGGRTKSLIYGEFNADPTKQVLNVNGHLNTYSLNGVSLFIKEGNNGTVSGDTYCKGAEWGRVGFCIAVKRLDTGEYIETDVEVQTPVSCLCGTF